MLKLKIHKTNVDVLLGKLVKEEQEKIISLIDTILTFEDENFPRLKKYYYSLSSQIRTAEKELALEPSNIRLKNVLKALGRKLLMLKWLERSDGKVHFLKHNPAFGTYHFGIGFLKNVKILLKSQGIPFVIIREKIKRIKIGNDDLPEGIQERGYQRKAVEKFLKRRRGIIQLPTGSGKTEVGRQIVTIILNKIKSKKKFKTLFITSEKSLTVQARDYFKRILKIPIGLICEGKNIKTDSSIICATIQSLESMKKRKRKKFQRLLKSVNFYIVDECHGFATAKRISFLKKMVNADYTLFLSATPYSRFTPVKNAKLNEFSGGVIYSVPEHKLIKQKFLARQKAFFIENYVPDWKTDHATRRKFSRYYEQMIVKNATRNKIGEKIFRVLKRYTIKSLFLVERKEHGKILLERFGNDGVKFLEGKDDTDMRKKFIRLLGNGNIQTLITTNIFRKGVDIPQLQCVVNMSGYRSDIYTTQLKGRISRIAKGKDRSLYIDFMDYGKFVEGHSIERIETVKSLRVPVCIIQNEKIEKEIKKYFEKGEYHVRNSD